ncbi:hypothetical protein METP3_00181 [Methanosarcinales archaeon]|nr:hypothetical protein METP3_00181 [Methanosarcinales archaeon]
MAEAVKKAVKAEKPTIDDKAAKEAAKATLLALAQTDAQKAAAVKAPSAVQPVQKPEDKAVKAIPKSDAVQAEPVKATAPEAKPATPKAESVKAESVKSSATEKPEISKAEAIKAEPVSEVKTEASKAEVKKEADPSKEFVDGIMTEMSLKGASKKRLIKMLGEQFNFDKQRVIFKLKRALISERYAALHEAAGH